MLVAMTAPMASEEVEEDADTGAVGTRAGSTEMGRPAPLSLDWEATSDTLGAELNGTRLIGTAGEDAFVLGSTGGNTAMPHKYGVCT